MERNSSQCRFSENTGLSKTSGYYQYLTAALTPEAICLMDLNPSWRGQRMWMLSSPSSQWGFFLLFLFSFFPP